MHIEQEQREWICKKELQFNKCEMLEIQIPTWQEIWGSLDSDTKRALVNKLIERIDITKEKMVVKFKIDKENFLCRMNFVRRMNCDTSTIPYIHDSE